MFYDPALVFMVPCLPHFKMTAVAALLNKACTEEKKMLLLGS